MLTALAPLQATVFRPNSASYPQW